MNNLTIIGNLTMDPVLRTVNIGGVDTKVCNFSVAVNTGTTEHRRTNFFRVTTWRGQAEVCAQYLSKGKKVCVMGEVSCSTYQTQDRQTRASLDVQARTVEFLSPVEHADAAPAAPAPAEMPAAPAPAAPEAPADGGDMPW